MGIHSFSEMTLDEKYTNIYIFVTGVCNPFEMREKAPTVFEAAGQ
jgi:hypothetical protein